MTLLLFGFVLGCIVFGFLGVLTLAMSPRIQFSFANLVVFVAGAYAGFGAFLVGLLLFSTPCKAMPSRAGEWFLISVMIGGTATVRMFNIGKFSPAQREETGGSQDSGYLGEWRLIGR